MPSQLWQQISAAMAQPASASKTDCRLGKGALREQRISGVPGPFSSFESLTLAFGMCAEWLRCYLSVVTDSISTSSARKCQTNRVLEQVM